MPFELRRGRSLFTLPDPIKSAGEAAAPATVSLGGVFCELVKELTEHLGCSQKQLDSCLQQR